MTQDAPLVMVTLNASEPLAANTAQMIEVLQAVYRLTQAVVNCEAATSDDPAGMDAADEQLSDAIFAIDADVKAALDEITESLLRQFQAEHGLEHLRKDEAFESFAAYCVIGQHHEDEFNPDDVRVGGPGDLGIDAAAVLIGGELFTDAEVVRQAVAKSSSTSPSSAIGVSASWPRNSP